MEAKKINIYKDTYLPKPGGYKGGKGKAEVKKLLGDKKIYKLSSNENILTSSLIMFDALFYGTLVCDDLIT